MVAGAQMPESGAMPDPTGTHTRKLVRLPDEGHIAGVCAGLARYLNVDPLIVRIAAVVLLFSGPGFFVYLAAWLFVPAADGSMLVDQVPPIPEDRHTQVVGIVLIASAILLLGGGWWWWAPSRHWLLPLMLVGAGCWLLLRRERGDDGRPVSPVPTPPAAPGSAPWAWPSPPVPTSDPDEGASVTDVSTPDLDATTDTDATAVDATASSGAAPPPPPTDAATAEAMFPPVPPVPTLHDLHHARHRRRFVGPLVFGALLIWGGAAWLGGVALQDALAIGLVIVGGGFVLGAFFGGSRGLIFPALLVGAALVFTSVVDIPWDSGIGNRSWDVQRTSQLKDEYQLGIGQANLDLRDLSLARTSTRHVKVELGVGHMVIDVPDELNVEITAHAGAGELELLGRTDNGVSAELERSVAGSADQGTLVLDLDVGLGHIEVIGH
jgi:phage shock protein PspC (stress-responsive transcriptional regulator)